MLAVIARLISLGPLSLEQPEVLLSL